MRLGIDGQHGVAENWRALGGFPDRPEPGNPHRFTIDPSNSCCDGLATAPVRLEKIFRRDDAMLALAPGIPETGFAGYRLAAGVVGVTCNFGVRRPVRHQTEQAGRWRRGEQNRRVRR